MTDPTPPMQEPCEFCDVDESGQLAPRCLVELEVQLAAEKSAREKAERERDEARARLKASLEALRFLSDESLCQLRHEDSCCLVEAGVQGIAEDAIREAARKED